MPIELTPIISTAADGYYVKRPRVLNVAGTDTFNAIFNLDNTSLVADEAVVQGIFDDTDEYIDGKAREFGITPANSSHYIAADDETFKFLKGPAAERARAKGALLRGVVDQSGNGPEGQMTTMLDRAELRIAEILAAHAGGEAVTGEDTNSGITVIAPACTCPPYPIGVIW